MNCWQLVKAIARLYGLIILSTACLVILSGCESEYPPDLKYPLRAEPLVASPLSSVPPEIDRPGELTQILFHVESSEDRRNIITPNDLKANQTQELEGALGKLFGTPRSPTITGIDDTSKQRLQLDDKTLAQGSELYRLHCLHCHGLTGNGRGPTAPWVNPHPRDYRQGIFKFTSTRGGNDRKPRRADLLRTLREGIEGTSMPSFGLLPSEQLEALASYVIHLSIRGELEFNLMKELLKGTLEDTEFVERINDFMEAIAGAWKAGSDDSNIIRPDPSASFPVGAERREAVQRGFRLFRDTSAAGCIGCHKDYGRQISYFYDVWGTIGRPADLTTGVYRGGRRPIDMYWRIDSGVNGSNMPAFNGLLKSKDIWDMVSFLQVLPFPKMRQEYGVEID